MLSLIALVNQAQLSAGLKGSSITFRHTNAAVITFPISSHMRTKNALAVNILAGLCRRQGIRYRIIHWQVGRMVGRAVYIPNGFFL